MDFNEFEKLIDDYQKTVAETRQKLSTNIKTIFKQIFEENPTINAFCWEQYTPYFNDGDTCTFSVVSICATNATGDDPNLIKWGEYLGDNEDVEIFDCYSTSKKQKEFVKSFNSEQVMKFLKMLESDDLRDVMLATFGDHVNVVATRDGFEITECYHD
jgi:hypothetical protein